MAAESGRPQDQGRAHRKSGRPSPETLRLLSRYQDAMRNDLSYLLSELEPKAAPPGLLPPDGPEIVSRPAIADRVRLWDLAIKLGRELGTEIDATPDTPDVTPRRPRRARVDFG